MVEHATRDGLVPTKVVCEVGFGLNEYRSRLLALLSDPTIGTVGVEHGDRLAGFGVEYFEAALAAEGRRVVVADQVEIRDDLVRDTVDVLNGLCARPYGRRSAKRRASAALAATETETAG